MRPDGEQIAALWVGCKEFCVLESGDVVGFNKVSVEHGRPLRMSVSCPPTTTSPRLVCTCFTMKNPHGVSPGEGETLPNDEHRISFA
jgi:hypothetical protein